MALLVIHALECVSACLRYTPRLAPQLISVGLSCTCYYEVLHNEICGVSCEGFIYSLENTNASSVMDGCKPDEAGSTFRYVYHLDVWCGQSRSRSLACYVSILIIEDNRMCARRKDARVIVVD